MILVPIPLPLLALHTTHDSVGGGTQGTATAEWTYDHDNSGVTCVPHTEVGLRWEETSGGATASGSGSKDDFYSLIGTISGTPMVFKGNLTHGTKVVGTFLLTKDAPQLPATCHAPPPPPSPVPNPPHSYTNSAVWPMPRSISQGTTALKISPRLSFTVAGNSSALPSLDAALNRFRSIAFQHRVSPVAGPALTSMDVRVRDPDALLGFGMDEQYNLTIPADPAGSGLIESNTLFGLYHALETITQLLQFDFDDENYQITGVPLRIDDGPRFPWRELMVDTSRHFLPLTVLNAVVDSMLTAKLNVLHLHLVDSQAFPLVLPSAPRLVLGAYSEVERYTLNDLVALQRYAAARGVRVVAEIDTPG